MTMLSTFTISSRYINLVRWNPIGSKESAKEDGKILAVTCSKV